VPSALGTGSRPSLPRSARAEPR